MKLSLFSKAGFGFALLVVSAAACLVDLPEPALIAEDAGRAANDGNQTTDAIADSTKDENLEAAPDSAIMLSDAQSHSDADAGLDAARFCALTDAAFCEDFEADDSAWNTGAAGGLLAIKRGVGVNGSSGLELSLNNGMGAWTHEVREKAWTSMVVEFAIRIEPAKDGAYDYRLVELGFFWQSNDAAIDPSFASTLYTSKMSPGDGLRLSSRYSTDPSPIESPIQSMANRQFIWVKYTITKASGNFFIQMALNGAQVIVPPHRFQDQVKNGVLNIKLWPRRNSASAVDAVAHIDNISVVVVP
jgi:hypothetical protein